MKEAHEARLRKADEDRRRREEEALVQAKRQAKSDRVVIETYVENLDLLALSRMMRRMRKRWMAYKVELSPQVQT